VSSVAEKRILVAGASGYAGALAAELVDRHPALTLAAATSRSDAGNRLASLYPQYRCDAVLEELSLGEHGELDAAIVAYPHGASAPIVAALRAGGVPVVDLSADFRLRDHSVYEQWYVPHVAPELLAGAVYGLPERNREQIKGAGLVANPGCYPTASVLALAPLAPFIADVVIDAKSGVSGAGREPSAVTHFVSVDENVKPYGVGHHRHMPEIDQELALAGADDLAVTFTPHLVPLDQGELVSCYVTLNEAVDIDSLYAAAYANEQFVEVVDYVPGVREVRGTNLCRINVRIDERTGKAFVFAVIDNLWKGAASQALQNLNLMLGLPEQQGIEL
jgi:N-acetyl-gamma-glutamyl-phosphate reductase